MTMKQGDRGPGVQLLQEALNATGRGDCRCVADGVYGKNTAYAVLMYQRSTGEVSGISLGHSGVADGDTLRALGLPEDLTATSHVVIDSTGGGV